MDWTALAVIVLAVATMFGWRNQSRDRAALWGALRDEQLARHNLSDEVRKLVWNAPSYAALSQEVDALGGCIRQVDARLSREEVNIVLGSAVLCESRLNSLAEAMGWKYVPEGKTPAKWERVNPFPREIIDRALPTRPLGFGITGADRTAMKDAMNRCVVGCEPAAEACRCRYDDRPRKVKPTKRKGGR